MTGPYAAANELRGRGFQLAGRPFSFSGRVYDTCTRLVLCPIQKQTKAKRRGAGPAPAALPPLGMAHGGWLLAHGPPGDEASAQYPPRTGSTRCAESLKIFLGGRFHRFTATTSSRGCASKRWKAAARQAPAFGSSLASASPLLEHTDTNTAASFTQWPGAYRRSCQKPAGHVGRQCMCMPAQRVRPHRVPEQGCLRALKQVLGSWR
jgi:hypothetical protein